MDEIYPTDFWEPRDCFLVPIPEMHEASELLSNAADKIWEGNLHDAAQLILEADIPVLAGHNTKIAASRSIEIHRYRDVANAPEIVRSKKRMPPYNVELAIFARDGWHCRFCQTRVVSRDVRKKLHSLFPKEARWGRANSEKHRGLSILESSLDHLLPQNRGGDNSPENLVTACGPCQFGRGSWTIEEVGINDPFRREPIVDGWDGLRRLLGAHA